jgi:phosphohistidine phosphatase SixA
MSSTTRTITYGDLERFLTQIGFKAEQARSDYLLFKSARPDVLIVLPARRAENGVLDEASFERLLWGTEPTVASP